MRRVHGFLILLMVVLAGCGSATPTQPAGAAQTQSLNPTVDVPVGVGDAGGAAPTCPDAPGPIDGAIVFGADNNLFAVGTDGGATTQITNIVPNTYAYEPAWSPDGQTLAYTLSAPTSEPDLSWLPVGRICGLDRSTGKGRLLAAGAGTLDSLTEAAWTPDGQALVLTMHQPKLDANRVYTGDTMTIVRYDLATGAQQTLVKDGFNPTVSPDGQRLVYMQINTTDLSTKLWFANVDGQSASPLTASDPTMGQIVTPRWSPDGAQLAFGAANGMIGGAATQPAARSWFERLLGVRVAQAHGVPADIWLVDPSGQSPRRVTNKGLDDPRIAWSPDGKQIAYTHGYGGVFVLDLDSLQEQMLTEQGNYGGISWAR